MIIRTQRLILRELGPADLDAVWVLFSHPEIVKTTLHSFTRERCSQWIEKLQKDYAARGFSPWGAELQPDRRLIGYCGLDVEYIEGVREVEIGFRFHPSLWGRGLATEAATAVLRCGFTDLGLQRIVATVLERNGASLRVVEKSGMRYEKDTILYGQTLRLYAAHANSWTVPACVGNTDTRATPQPVRR